MPNWCNNRLTITAPAHILTEIRQLLQSGDIPISFQNVVPVPPEIRTADTEDDARYDAWASAYNDTVPADATPEDMERHYKAYTAANGARPRPGERWYNWRLENWGTKWDLDEQTRTIRVSPTSVTYVFDTAWSPPCPIVLALGKRFPRAKLTLWYSEPGLGFRGRYCMHNGENTTDVETAR